ncbi:uncharacterized protein LOC127247388 [Andrographis paniculata]|uniref:uncharacterized protein LOC127247388 n=1 Tax=Andrographis paniculata TaxID=175694 RepID=UPI0021E8BA03|nr:uncharacterized protein LOC127247388 [Andrographis paniculata]
MENMYISNPRLWRWKTTSTTDQEEFHEADIWGASAPRHHNSDADSDSDSPIINVAAAAVSRRLPTASRMIPKSNSGHKKEASLQQQDPKMIQRSAPLNIPDWSKIYGGSYSGGGGEGCRSSSWESDEEEEEADGEGKIIPPHEWVAARRVASFSVVEGAGRKLKGRDLSRVRNDVLTKTGFLEPQ